MLSLNAVLAPKRTSSILVDLHALAPIRGYDG